jgi:PAS domain S-box-containing protein
LSNSPANTAKTGMNEAQIAVLVLDEAGKVTAANQGAKALWQTGAGELVGEAFPGLFEIDVSDEPRMVEAQWDVLLSATLGKSAILSVQPREGAPRPMVVRAEKAIGPADGYIVVVEALLEPNSPAASFPDDQAEALQLFAEKGDVGFFDLNLKARRVVYSPAWKRMLGYTDSELADTYEAWLSLIHPEDSAAAPDKAGRRFKVGARPFSVEFRMKHKQGHWAWIHCAGLQMVSTWGDLERVIGIHIDATERKEIEEAALAGEARLRTLTDEGSLAAFELDLLGKTSWFSDAWMRLVGDAPDPEEGLSALADALPVAEVSEGIEPWLLAQSPGQTSFARVLEMRSRGGKSFPAVLGINRMLTRRRTLARVAGFIVALPDGRLPEVPTAAPVPAEATPAPVSNQGLYDEVLGALSEGVIATDSSGHVLFGNATASRLLRIPIDQFSGRPLDQIFSLVDRNSGKPTESVADRTLSSGGRVALSNDQSVAASGGDPVPVAWTARAAYNPDSSLRGLVIVFRNPDEMALTPDELIKANRLESLAALAGGIASDFNNLLTTILGGLSLAKDSRDPSGLADAEEACLSAKNLTKQLITFAKGGPNVMTVCEPKDVLQEAAKIAGAGSNAEIVVQSPAGTGAVKVDRGQILQVFQNLILNALQAMPPAPHVARIQLRAADVHLTDGQIVTLPAGEYVEFEVRDNGSGITPENIERVWDPFFTTKKHGTGLGLSTAMSVIRKLGGEIGLQSTVGVGTVFSVFLPIADQPVDVQARSAPTPRFNTGRILFMDDDDHICSLTASMLQSLDYKFDIVKNGDDAITFYKRYLNIGRPYDAVIMDLTVVGGLGGEEAFRVLRDLDPEIRAIVSTGYDSEDMARQFLDMGFCGYLTKPYRVSDLGKVLKAVIG